MTKFRQAHLLQKDEKLRRRRHRIDVIHADDDLIVVNKPAGILIDEGFEDDPGVVDQLIAAGHASADDALHAVYPLDPDVSGVCLITRTDAARDQLAAQISDGRLELTYLALVNGHVMDDTGEIELPICPRSEQSNRLKVDAERGHPAVTTWRLVDRFVGFALLACRPISMLHQQVRVHLQAVGLPLAVDPMYGGGTELRLSSFKAGYTPSRRRPERPLIDRQTLHAASLRFLHPVSGEPLTYEAEPPKDFHAALHQLDRFGRIPGPRA